MPTPDGGQYALLPFVSLFLNHILNDIYDLSKSDSLKYHAIVLKIMMNISKAIKRMHDLGYVHRDVKPENICFYQGNFCIIDLDTAEKINSNVQGMVPGTPIYTHPHCGTERTFCNDPKNDIFALGQTMQILLNQGLLLNITADWTSYVTKQKDDYVRANSPSDAIIMPDFKVSVEEQKDIYKQLTTIAERMSSLAVRNQPSLEEVQSCLSIVYEKVTELYNQRKENEKNLEDNIEQVIIEMALKQKDEALESETNLTLDSGNCSP